MDLADIPEEVRDDLTIYTVDTIDQVLEHALEKGKEPERLETPQLWDVNAPGADVSTSVE